MAGLGAGLAAGLAGCAAAGNGTDETPTAGSMPESPPEGGTATLGLSNGPTSLNPLTYSTAAEYEAIRRVYDVGVTTHPTTYDYAPWTFVDWSVHPENAGTSSPTVRATMRDDTTFSDGTPVTPEDFAFTVQYLKEQNVTGQISAAQVSAVEDVAVGDSEVDIFLSEPYNGWFADVLGQVILPKHVWRNVSDYTTYEPRKEGGPVGSGPMVLEDYAWGNWLNFAYREDEAVPWPRDDRIDWLHDEGPFLDRVRLQIYGNRSTMREDLLAGDLTAMYQGVSPSDAETAQNTDGIEVAQNPSRGYDHVSFNLRRTPFDDVAFRQFLRKLFDGDWVVEGPYEGIGAEKGTYPSIASFEDWRPPEPWEADEYDGVPLPTLAFPGEAGTFELDADAVAAARDFLVDHDEAVHDYAFAEGSQPATDAPDGAQLFVNGEPLTEAHTDNDGTGGQGPIEFLYEPPGEDRTQNAVGEAFTAALRRVGVPVSPTVQSQSTTEMSVYFAEDFDMYSMGWGITPYLVSYRSFYGAAGVDTEGTTDRPFLNPMGYTGAQDAIEADARTMERSERIPHVKRIQAQIWHDAPTIVTAYKNLLEPHPAAFGGFTETAGGLFETPWMNVYREG